MKTCVVVAAYNEEKRLASVVRDLKKAGYDWVVIVDDGSSDKTASIAEKAGATVLQHIINRGQGAALRTGIHYAADYGAEAIVTFDADGQHQVSDIPRLLKPIEDGKADIVFGSRFLGKAVNITAGKRFVLKLGALVMWIFSGIRLTDSHNGLRALNKKAAKRIVITFDGMEHASDFVEETGRNHLRWKEVPVTIVYHEKGQHPLKAIRMGFKLLARKVFGW